MTISEMHNAVKMGLDKTSSLSLPAFENVEIDFWLNKAQEKFIDMIYNEYKQLGEGSRMYDFLAPILMTFSTTSDLEKPLNKDESTGISTNAIRKNLRMRRIVNPATPTVFTDYSDDLRHILSVYAYLENNYLEDGTFGTATSLYKCDSIKEEDSIHYLKNAFNVPYFENPVYYVTQDYGYATTTTTPSGSSWPTVNCKELVIIYNSFASGVGQLYVSAIRNPRQVIFLASVGCELPVIAHQKIVDLTVAMLLENIESSRIETNTQLLNI